MIAKTMPYDVAAEEASLAIASDAYHNGDPVMSDEEFDRRWKKHRQMREAYPDQFPADSILDEVGAKPPKSSGFRKVKHSEPMLSLDNVFEAAEHSVEELNRWLAKVVEACGGWGCLLAVEPKIDGLSLRLTYQACKLVSAVTRGDGSQGDDVTANVLAARLAPAELLKDFTEAPGRLEVNGEVFMDFAAFRGLNARQRAAGEPEYANPRNAAAGALRLHDPAEVAKRGLRFVPHGLIGGRFARHSNAMTWLESQGFEKLARAFVAAEAKFGGAEEVRDMVLSGVDYPTDGAVFKIDLLEARQLMPGTSRAPGWAVALKFLPEQATTVLKAITIQVGRSGVLTPVAELEPVLVDGSTISRATLHNEAQVRRLGLQVGDQVVIAKMGAVIPGLIRSVTHDERFERIKRDHEFNYEYIPDDNLVVLASEQIAQERPPFDLVAHIGGKCPACGSPDIQRALLAKQASPQAQAVCENMMLDTLAPDDGFVPPADEALKQSMLEASAWRCCNPDCSAQLAAKIEHFCSRKCLDIEMIGGEAAEAIAEHMRELQETGGASPSPLNLFEWDTDEFAGLAWINDSGTAMTFGEKRAEKVMAALVRARKLPLHRWLFALGIPSIGENTSKELSRLFRTATEIHHEAALGGTGSWLEALAADGSKAKERDDLRNMLISSHLGPVSCKALLTFARSPRGMWALNRMAEYGVQSENYNPIPMKTDEKPLTGKIFVITGTLSVGRSEIQALIESKGGKCSGSVSAKTNYLVAGEDCGSKLDKAKKLNVTILTESALREML